LNKFVISFIETYQPFNNETSKIGIIILSKLQNILIKYPTKWNRIFGLFFPYIKLFQVLFNLKEYIMISDILLYSLKEDLNFKLELYLNIKHLLIKEYFSENIKSYPLTQYCIIMYFFYINNEKKNKKFHRIKGFHVSKNTDDFLDNNLLFIFLSGNIGKYVNKLKNYTILEFGLMFENMKLQNNRSLVSSEQAYKNLKNKEKEMINNQNLTEDKMSINFINHILQNTIISYLNNVEQFPIFQSNITKLPFILYINYNNITDIFKFINDNNSFLNINDTITYELTGMIIITHNNEKETLLYNKHNQQWYNIATSTYLNNQVFFKIKQTFVVYYKKKTKNQYININNINNIELSERTIDFSLCKYKEHFQLYNNFQKENFMLCEKFTLFFSRLDFNTNKNN
jgi:hypothetical protein